MLSMTLRWEMHAVSPPGSQRVQLYQVTGERMRLAHRYDIVQEHMCTLMLGRSQQQQEASQTTHEHLSQ